MRITFVRHGESEANSTGRWQGQGDSPLSTLGREQALRAARRLDPARFTRVLSSDLSRARDTARATGREPELDPELREIHVGAWEGMRREDVLEKFPEEISALVRGDDVKIGGGESWSEATERARRALDRHLAGATHDDHLAVFSHGGIITSLFLHFLRAASRRPPPIGHMVNTAISEVQVLDGDFVVERYNDASHEPATSPHRRVLFGDDATVAGYLAADASVDLAALATSASIFADVDMVLRSPDSSSDLTRDIAQSLGKPVADGEFLDIDEIRERHGAKSVLVVASPSEVGATIREATRPMLQGARFAHVPIGSLSHLARTRSTRILVDYGARVLEV